MLKRGAELGFIKQVDYARACDVAESTIGRLLYEENLIPEWETLVKVAAGLGLDADDLSRLARGKAAVVGLVVEVGWRSPQGAEIDRMLNPASPLTDEQRADLEKFFEHMIDPLRKFMRRSSKAN